jgi:hypothetical protein
MFKRGILFLLLIIGIFSSELTFAAKRKSTKHSTHRVSGSAKHKVSKKSKKAKKGTKTYAKGRSRYARYHKKSNIDVTAKLQNTVVDNKGDGPKQMIALNTEKARITDSVNKSSIISGGSKDNEGYFASLFAAKNRAASFQTLEGTAAVFKSISGWDDKKFYVLTNLLPVGTIVRITTPDLKSICAKVINALPEVGNSVQYRLNDAAAAILGINNKTFPVSVTY